MSVLAPSTDHAPLTTDHYLIGGELYRLEPASFRQHRWLGEGPLKGLDFSEGISQAELHTVIQRHGPEILGIVLIPSNMTREDKAKAGLQAAHALAERIDCCLTPEEVRPIAETFFVRNGYQNLAYFIDFHALAARMPAEAASNGSRPAAASSPAATLRSETGSVITPDRETAKSTCAGSSSGN